MTVTSPRLFVRPVALLGFALLAAFTLGTVGGCASANHHPATQTTAFENMSDPPISAQTHFAAGQYAESTGNANRAMAQYKVALKMDPNHLPSLYRLAILYVKLKDFHTAIATWKQYIVATHDSADAYNDLAFCYELDKLPREAEATYLEGVRRDPSCAACRVNFGLMLARQSRINEAIVQLQSVLSDPEVHYNLASVYESLGRRELAKAEYQKTLALKPDFSEAQTRLDLLK